MAWCRPMIFEPFCHENLQFLSDIIQNRAKRDVIYYLYWFEMEEKYHLLDYFNVGLCHSSEDNRFIFSDKTLTKQTNSVQFY